MRHFHTEVQHHETNMLSITTLEQTENLAKTGVQLSEQTHFHHTEISTHVFIFHVSDLEKRATELAVLGGLFNVDMEALVR